MQFSRNWLAQYVDLPPSAEELARLLTAAGLAVEDLAPVDHDLLLDVDVTTNRPDCMNHLGLAREVSVLTGEPLRPPGPEPAETGAAVAEAARVTLEDRQGCPRYVARLVRDVTVGPSPAWLKERLEAIGLRPINNVVDVTNFVLWETGQPLHAFDLDKLEGPEIRVRRARAGETLVTLDGVEREVGEEILVIADAVRPVAVAGVMGGLDSEVTSETRHVLIESAHFHPRRVRIGARTLAMHTDASHRFERGADPGACLGAATRAAALLAEVAGGQVAPGAIDERGEMPTPPAGPLELAKLNAFAGVEVPAGEVERILTGLGFGLEHPPEQGGDGAWRVSVPTWRHYDFDPRDDERFGTPGETYPQDLYEEVLRIYGYDRIPSTLPHVSGSDAPLTTAQVRRERIREILVASGYAEAISFAFHARAADERCPTILDGSPVELQNPLSERYDVLRRSLVPNLLEAARFNLKRGAEAVRLFEVGHVFAAADGGETDEREVVAWVAGGRVGSPWQRQVELDLFDVKGVAELVAEAVLGSHRSEARLTARPAELAGVVPGTGARLSVAGREAGWLGRLDDEETETALYAVELSTDVFSPEGAGFVVSVPSRFPGVEADLTFTHARDLPWAEIEAEVARRPPADLVRFELLDRYEGEGVPAGSVNTTIHFAYGSSDRSLTQEEVNERQSELARRLEDRFGGGRG